MSQIVRDTPDSLLSTYGLLLRIGQPGGRYSGYIHSRLRAAVSEWGYIIKIHYPCMFSASIAVRPIGLKYSDQNQPV